MFLAMVVPGREEMAVVANSASWSNFHAVVMAVVAYSLYVLVLVTLSWRIAWLRRKVDRLTSSRRLARLFGRIDAAPIPVQYAVVVLIGFVPTFGFGCGVLWAIRGSRRERLGRMPAVVLGAVTSYLCYGMVIALLLSLPLLPGLGALAVIAAVVYAIHHRERFGQLRGRFRYPRSLPVRS